MIWFPQGQSPTGGLVGALVVVAVVVVVVVVVVVYGVALVDSVDLLTGMIGGFVPLP